MPVTTTIESTPTATETAVAEALSRLLADSYTLYLQTQNFHWNVVGPMFSSLHLLFEQQYTELALAIDTIAERIRALGFPAPGSYREFGRLTSIPIADELPRAEEMIRLLLLCQGAVIRTARAGILAAESTSDQPTLDLLTQRIQVHEKNAWMLRSLLS
jgi:starvation-inducible DNA-binding protein